MSRRLKILTSMSSFRLNDASNLTREGLSSKPECIVVWVVCVSELDEYPSDQETDQSEEVKKSKERKSANGPTYR
jgi:hypothetical protein